MPDSFFVTKKSRKRTRSGASKAEVKTKLVNGKGRPAKVTGARAKRRDEELDSDETDADGAGGIDELELRASDSDPGASGEEDDLETPAQKRLRLAKEYIESVKEGLGALNQSRSRLFSAYSLCSFSRRRVRRS